MIRRSFRGPKREKEHVTHLLLSPSPEKKKQSDRLVNERTIRRLVNERIGKRAPPFVFSLCQ